MKTPIHPGAVDAALVPAIFNISTLMIPLRFFVGMVAAAILLIPPAVEAGQYTQNFDLFGLGATNFGDGSQLFSSEPGIAKVEDPALKELQLSQWDTTNTVTRAAFLLPDLDPGEVVKSFSASWDSPVYGNFPSAAIGFSFSFGSLPTNDLASAAYLPERGFGTGLSFCVQTYDLPITPGWYIRKDGTVLATVTNNPVATWGVFSPTRHAFQVSWDQSTGLSASQNGVVIFTNVPTPGFVPKIGDSFAWATRSGTGIGETFRIDNISVTTVTGNPVIQSAAVSTVPLRPQITISAAVNTKGVDTTVSFLVGTNLSYSAGATNNLAGAAGVTPVTFVVPLDTDRSLPVYTYFMVSNIFGTAVTNVVIQSISFERIINGSENSAVVWADLNDDGRLDVMAAGARIEPEGTIRVNPGTATNRWGLRPTWGGFRPFVTPGDFDNDNRPDLFCVNGPQRAGFPHQAIIAAIVYGVSTQPGTDLLWFPFYLTDARTIVRDFDHDGRQDILTAGAMWPYSGTDFTFAPEPQVMTGLATRLMRNEFTGARGSNTASYFSMTPSQLPHLGGAGGQAHYDAGFFSGGELDGDGFPDIYFSGRSVHGIPGANQQSRDWEIFRTDGEMGIVSIARGNRGFNNAALGSSANLWADFNGDGREDVLVSEGSVNWDGGLFTQILLNDGQGHLTNSGWTLPQVVWQGIAAGDIFNHGRNDIVIVGATNYFGPAVFRILRNEGNGVFTPMDFGFPDDLQSNQGTGGLELADYDKDGRLDIAHALGGVGFEVAGHTENSFSVCRNELNIPSNAPPQAPVNLSTVVGPGTATFHWGSATDDITPTNLLTYNLRVGTNSLGTSVVSPLANVTNGWRKVSGPGNCRHIFSTLYRFPPGTYYWSVQAVDGAYSGGAWAPEQTFTITEKEVPKLDIARGTNTTIVSWPARLPGWTLQQNSSLGSTNWIPAMHWPSHAYGKLQVVRNASTGAGFFRLKSGPYAYSQGFTPASIGQVSFGDGSTLVSSTTNALGVQDPLLWELQLTHSDIANSRSAFLLPDLNPGQRISSFSVSWVSPVYGNFPNAGVGFSFSFGPVRSLDLTNSVYDQESGYGVGLTLSVKTGGPDPGYYLLRNGVVIASAANNPTTEWGNLSSTRHEFLVNWNEATGLNVSRNGVVIFANVPTTGFTSAPGDSFVWAARSGAFSQTFRVDNILVLTTPAP